jgi:hypothetical protein
LVIQTNKPNSNPIQSQTNPIPERPGMNVKQCNTKDYEEKCGYRPRKNKANSNPIQTQSSLSSNVVVAGQGMVVGKPMRKSLNLRII